MLGALAPADGGVPDLRGLWMGDYGNGRIETVRIEQEGPVVLAVKVTGDENVPAGKPTFRTVLRGQENDGEGHGADEGYRNPRWVPGHLSIVSPTTIVFRWAGMSAVEFRRMER